MKERTPTSSFGVDFGDKKLMVVIEPKTKIIRYFFNKNFSTEGNRLYFLKNIIVIHNTRYLFDNILYTDGNVYKNRILCHENRILSTNEIENIFINESRNRKLKKILQ